MKKLTAIILAVVMCFALAACGGSSAPAANTNNAPAANTGSSTEAAAPEYTFSISWEASEESVGGQALVFFKKHIEELSNGRITCNVYQNAALGTSREVIEGLQNQQVTMMLCITSTQASFVPDLSVFSLPFAFKNSQEVRGLTQDAHMKEVIQAMYEAKGFHWIGAVDGGFRTLSSNKLINKPADMKGVVIRTPDNKFQLATWNSIGATATPLAYAELFTALQQGTVDAQDNPIEMDAQNKLYDVQHYFYNTNHEVNSYMMIMNKDFFYSLPEDLQAAVEEAGQLAVKDCWDYFDANFDKNVQTIKDNGGEFVEFSDDVLNEFKSLAMPVWDMIKEGVSADVYNEFTTYIDSL